MIDRRKEGDPSACYRCGYDEEKVYRDAQQLLCQVNPRRDADLRRFRDDRKLPSQKRKQHWIREVRDGLWIILSQISDVNFGDASIGGNSDELIILDNRIGVEQADSRFHSYPRPWANCEHVAPHRSTPHVAKPE